MDSAQRDSAGQSAVERSAAATLIALTAGAVAIVAPTLSLLVLAALGARVLMREGAATQFKPISIAGPAFVALIVGAFVGLAGAIGVVFAWRLLADARWSALEADRLAAAAGRPVQRGLLTLAHVWLTPIYGLSLVAFTAPHMVAGCRSTCRISPLSRPCCSASRRRRPCSTGRCGAPPIGALGELALAPSAHLLAHHLIFFVAFGCALDLSAGIVALVAWRLAHAAPLKFQASLTAVP